MALTRRNVGDRRSRRPLYKHQNVVCSEIAQHPTQTTSLRVQKRTKFNKRFVEEPSQLVSVLNYFKADLSQSTFSRRCGQCFGCCCRCWRIGTIAAAVTTFVRSFSDVRIIVDHLVSKAIALSTEAREIKVAIVAVYTNHQAD